MSNTRFSIQTSSGGTVSVELPEGAVVARRVRFERVAHYASNNRISWIGRQVVVTLSDDNVIRCEHASGHRSRPAAENCASRIVDRLNRAAGIDPRTYKSATAANLAAVTA